MEAYWAAAWARTVGAARAQARRAAPRRGAAAAGRAGTGRGTAAQGARQAEQGRRGGDGAAAGVVAARAAVRSGLDEQLSERQVERQRAAEAEAEARRAAAEADEDVGVLRRKAREALLEKYAARDAPLENRLRLARWQLVRSKHCTYSPFARLSLSSLSARIFVSLAVWCRRKYRGARLPPRYL